MKIATWNVNGIRAREAQVAEWIERDQPDVVCLQEIKAASHQVPAALCELGGYWCYWHGAKGYSGVALHVRKDGCPERPHFAHPEFDMENRIVTADLGDLIVASVYVPNGGKDFPAKLRFLAALSAWAIQLRVAGKELVICGDINIARTEIDAHPKERRNVIGQLPEERAWFERVLAAGLVDLGRHFDPANENLFTWWAPWRSMRQRNIGWRLDYILASKGPAQTATGCVVRAETGTSDHAPVVAEFK